MVLPVKVAGQDHCGDLLVLGLGGGSLHRLCGH
jgi:hypothetical protein